MKYSQYSRERKGNSAFYIILAICLLIVGVTAWLAFSSFNDTNTNINPNAKNDTSQNSSEYNSNTSSYNESENQNGIGQIPQDGIDDGINQVPPTEPTADEVEDEPYTPPEVVKSYTMPVNGDILKEFNATALQYSATYGDMRIHNGVDITCTEGTIVSACTDGTVQSVEQSPTFGGVVTIDHGDGLVIKYASLKDITVKSGDTVSTGDTIGAVSAVPCECEDQSHIHLEAYRSGAGFSILSLFE